MDNINELSFEQAFDQLEDVIAQLESGDLSLEEQVMMSERGKLLSARCQVLLDNAELRIKKLEGDGTFTE
ncbi:MAG: exodeoxyribonuclease VII small subunit [Phototrophicaceae bacterium]